MVNVEQTVLTGECIPVTLQSPSIDSEDLKKDSAEPDISSVK